MKMLLHGVGLIVAVDAVEVEVVLRLVEVELDAGVAQLEAEVPEGEARE